MAKFQRILLTGGAGFVGSHLAPFLAEDFPDAERWLLTLRGGGDVAGDGWRRVEGDLLDLAVLDQTVEQLRPDLVVHLAGQASIGKALHGGEQTWRVNLVGSLHLAGALARYAPNATVLFASSATVYGETLLEGAVREDAPLRPLDAYGRSKAAAEGMFGDVLAPEARLIVVRPVNHTGPRQSEKNFVLASFAAQVAAIEAGRMDPVLRVGDLSKARDFLDVRDVVAAYRLLLKRADLLGHRHTTFNIASGAPRQIRDFLDGLQKRAKRRFALEVQPALLRPAAVDLPSVSLDASKLREVTGWAPTHSVDDMLDDLLEHWRRVETKRAEAL
jgi:GDP-4-dehydro-6-deoxy-D-mannose reductase